MNFVPPARKLKSCVNCTASKTKCLPHQNLNNLCERCHRLGKTCVYADAAVRSKKGRTSQRQQLEAKVDHLVSLLANANSNGAIVSTGLNQNVGESPSSTAGSGNIGLPSPESITLARSVAPATSPQSHSEVLDLIDCGLISSEQANHLFSKYCREYSSEFAFVTISPVENFSTVRKERPLLLQSILAVSLAEDPVLQRRVGREVAQMIKTKMMSRSNYTLDLLQATLIYAAWYQFFFRPSTQDFYLMTQFCVTLVHELGLDRNPTERKRNLGLHVDRTGPMGPSASEEMRALLGTHYLTSSFAQTSRKPGPISTKYIDKCCDRLAASHEYESDYLIGTLVHIHKICLQINETFSLYDVENGDVLGDTAIQALVGGYISRLELMEQGMASTNTDHQHSAVALQFLYAHVWAHEIAVHKELWHVRSSENSISPNSGLSTTRTRLAWEGLRSAKKYLESFLHFESRQLLHMGTTTMTQMLYVLIMINKFIFLDAKSQKVGDTPQLFTAETTSMKGLWNPITAGKEAEIQRLGLSLMEKVAAATTDTVCDEGGRDFMHQLGFLVRTMVEGHRHWICPHNEMSRQSEPPSSTSAGLEVGQSLPIQNGADSSNDPPILPEIYLNQWADLPDGAYSDLAWNAMMQDFTMIPLP